MKLSALPRASHPLGRVSCSYTYLCSNKSQSSLTVEAKVSWIVELSEFNGVFPISPRLRRPIWSDEHLLEPVLEQYVVVGKKPIGPAGNKWAERCLGQSSTASLRQSEEGTCRQLVTLAAASRARHVLQGHGHGPYWP